MSGSHKEHLIVSFDTKPEIKLENSVVRLDSELKLTDDSKSSTLLFVRGKLGSATKPISSGLESNEINLLLMSLDEKKAMPTVDELKKKSKDDFAIVIKKGSEYYLFCYHAVEGWRLIKLDSSSCKEIETLFPAPGDKTKLLWYSSKKDEKGELVFKSLYDEIERYYVRPSPKQLYLNFQDKATLAKTDDVEIFVGMKVNSVRVLIWDDKFEDTKCLPYRTDGHVAMAIKDDNEELHYISLYAGEKYSDDNFGEKANVKTKCTSRFENFFSGHDPVLYTSFFSRFSNEEGRPAGSFKKSCGADEIDLLNNDYKIDFKGEYKQRKKYPDYVVELDFSDEPDAVNKMKTYFYNYLKNEPKWRLCGTTFCYSNKYQNCNSLCYNVLEAGEYHKLLPTDLQFNCLSATSKYILEIGVIFGLILGISELINNTVNTTNISNDKQAENSILSAAILRITISLLLTTLTKAIRGCCSGRETSSAPVKFKETLIQAATYSSSRDSKIKLVHVADSLKNVCVVSTLAKDPPVPGNPQ